MKIKNKVSLQNRIFNLIGIVIAIILAFCIIITVTMRQMAQNNIRIQNEAMLHIVTDQIEDTIQTPVELIRNIKDLITDQYPLDGEVLTDYLGTIRKSYSYLSEIHIIDKEGRIINTAPFDSSLIGNSVIFEPYYKVGQIGDDHWSEVYISSNSGAPTISLTITEADYMIVADFNLSELPITLNGGLFDKIQHISVLDQWGTYIVADDYGKVEARFRYEFFDALHLNDPVTGEGINERYNVGYKKIEGLNWYIILEFDNGKSYQNLNGFMLLIFLLWSLMGFTAYLFLRRYFKDVKRELHMLQERAISFLHRATNPDSAVSEEPVELKFLELSHLYDDFSIMMNMILERQTEILTINSNLERLVSERTRNLEEINAQLEEEIQEREKAEEEVRSINESLDQQVKNRTQELEFLNGALQRSVQVAEQANEAKSRFLSIMSHEMRTPLNGILGFLQILASTTLDMEQEEIVSFINGSSKTLLELINDILEVEKYSAGKMIFDEEVINLKNTFEESFKQYQVLIRNKGLEFAVESTEELDIEVKADPMKLKQLIGNLLNNALKFTSEGRIQVRFKGITEDNRINLQIAVSDTGIGIKEEVRQYLFTPYTQADSKIALEFGGTGLGLAICKEIVSYYGGEIYFDSKYGEGTTFYVKLLLAKATVTVGKTEEISTYSRTGTDTDSIYKSILVAEDNAINQRLISIYLQKLNIEFMIANNGQEALELLHRKEFDLVLMDCQMPVMDGFEAARRIREEFGYSLKIIAMTAYTSQEDQERCKKSGMDEYLSKPIDLLKLANMIGVSDLPQDVKQLLDPVPTDLKGKIDKEARLLMQKLPFDYDVCYELIETYIRQMQAGFQEFDRCIEQKDYVKLGRKVHELKGASGAARQDIIMKRLEKVEQLIAKNQSADIIACLDKIKEEPLFKIQEVSLHE